MCSLSLSLIIFIFYTYFDTKWSAYITCYMIINYLKLSKIQQNTALITPQKRQHWVFDVRCWSRNLIKLFDNVKNEKGANIKRFSTLPVYKNGRLVILNMFVHFFYHLVIDLFLDKKPWPTITRIFTWMIFHK